MLKKIKISIVYILFLAFSSNAYGQEYIKSFVSNVVVSKDRTITVTEHITHVLSGEEPKRGLTRKFPTRYSDFYGNKYIVSFEVQKVLRNDQPVNYTVENYFNGKLVKIGDHDTWLKPGVYKYTITYKTDRQIGFFKNYDELFWNVTGEWPFSVLSAQVSVKLPDDIPADSIQAKAYTGYAGQKENDYKAYVDKDGIAHAETIKPLDPREQLSIVVIWPKGYIQPPSLWAKTYYILRDNIAYILLALSIIALLIFYIWYYLTQVINAGSKQPVIPLFYPPENLTPAAIRYIYNKKTDNKAFASDIVNLGVLGFIKIKHNSKLFNSYYELTRTEKPIEETNKFYQQILDILFEYKDALILKKSKYNKLVGSAWDKTEKYLQSNFSEYFESHVAGWSVGVIGSIIAVILALFTASFQFSMLFFIGIAILIIINIIFAYLFSGYTQEGYDLLNKIKGFKLFLETTETERLKVVGTPPVRTPELYEKYLPYAMALGIEQAWSEAFAPIFNKLKQEGINYQPIWYTGIQPFNVYRFNNISNNFTSTLASSGPMAASTLSPGSSSGWGGGSGGGGGAGGGGGGGGGGSW